MIEFIGSLYYNYVYNMYTRTFTYVCASRVTQACVQSFLDSTVPACKWLMAMREANSHGTGSPARAGHD